MAIGWFLVPYRIDTEDTQLRYCAMYDFSEQIRADGGRWSEAECLGNHAIVKVSADSDTLNTIANESGFMRIPMTLLDNTLSELTQEKRTAIKNKILSLGYTAQEIENKLSVNLANMTLRQVFSFILTRRLKPRWDTDAGEIKVDGKIQVCKTIEALNSEV